MLFRNMRIEYFGLDPWHYFSNPGLSWDVMLKIWKCTSLLKGI